MWGGTIECFSEAARGSIAPIVVAFRSVGLRGESHFRDRQPARHGTRGAHWSLPYRVPAHHHGRWLAGGGKSSHARRWELGLVVGGRAFDDAGDVQLANPQRLGAGSYSTSTEFSRAGCWRLTASMGSGSFEAVVYVFP